MGTLVPLTDVMQAIENDKGELKKVGKILLGVARGPARDRARESDAVRAIVADGAELDQEEAYRGAPCP